MTAYIFATYNGSKCSDWLKFFEHPIRVHKTSTAKIYAGFCYVGLGPVFGQFYQFLQELETFQRKFPGVAKLEDQECQIR